MVSMSSLPSLICGFVDLRAPGGFSLLMSCLVIERVRLVGCSVVGVWGPRLVPRHIALVILSRSPESRLSQNGGGGAHANGGENRLRDPGSGGGSSWRSQNTSGVACLLWAAAPTPPPCFCTAQGKGGATNLLRSQILRDLSQD